MFDKLKNRLDSYRPKEEKEGLDFSDAGDEPVTHSRHYHNYYEGYAERRKYDRARGKDTIERIYVEDYYVRAQTDRQWMVYRILYGLLYAASLAAFLYGCSRPLPLSTRYLQLPAFLGVIVFIFLGWILLLFLLQRRELTIWDYRSGSLRLRKLSLVAGCITALQAAAFALDLLVSQSWPENASAAVLACFVSAILLFLLYGLERRSVYTRKANPNSALKQQDGVYLIRR